MHIVLPLGVEEMGLTCSRVSIIAKDEHARLSPVDWPASVVNELRIIPHTFVVDRRRLE